MKVYNEKKEDKSQQKQNKTEIKGDGLLLSKKEFAQNPVFRTLAYVVIFAFIILLFLPANQISDLFNSTDKVFLEINGLNILDADVQRDIQRQMENYSAEEQGRYVVSSIWSAVFRKLDILYGEKLGINVSKGTVENFMYANYHLEAKDNKEEDFSDYRNRVKTRFVDYRTVMKGIFMEKIISGGLLNSIIVPTPVVNNNITNENDEMQVDYILYNYNNWAKDFVSGILNKKNSEYDSEFSSENMKKYFEDGKQNSFQKRIKVNYIAMDNKKDAEAIIENSNKYFPKLEAPIDSSKKDLGSSGSEMPVQDLPATQPLQPSGDNSTAPLQNLPGASEPVKVEKATDAKTSAVEEGESINDIKKELMKKDTPKVIVPTPTPSESKEAKGKPSKKKDVPVEPLPVEEVKEIKHELIKDVWITPKDEGFKKIRRLNRDQINQEPIKIDKKFYIYQAVESEYYSFEEIQNEKELLNDLYLSYALDHYTDKFKTVYETQAKEKMERVAADFKASGNVDSTLRKHEELTLKPKSGTTNWFSLASNTIETFPSPGKEIKEFLFIQEGDARQGIQEQKIFNDTFYNAVFTLNEDEASDLLSSVDLGDVEKQASIFFVVRVSEKRKTEDTQSEATLMKAKELSRTKSQYDARNLWNFFLLKYFDAVQKSKEGAGRLINAFMGSNNR